MVTSASRNQQAFNSTFNCDSETVLDSAKNLKGMVAECDVHLSATVPSGTFGICRPIVLSRHLTFYVFFLFLLNSFPTGAMAEVTAGNTVRVTANVAQTAKR